MPVNVLISAVLLCSSTIVLTVNTSARLTSSVRHTIQVIFTIRELENKTCARVGDFHLASHHGDNHLGLKLKIRILSGKIDPTINRMQVMINV